MKKRWGPAPAAPLLAAVLLAAALLEAGAARADGGPGAGRRRFTLIHFNDFYRIEGVDGRRAGGIARLGALIERQRERDEVLVTFGGDLISPSLMSREFGGAQMIEALNTVGVGAATFGNHEFDAPGPQTLLARLRESRFPWLAANARRAGGESFPGARARILRRVGGVRVGLFGLTRRRHRNQWVRVEPAIEAARREAAALKRAGAEVVVALTHLPMKVDRLLARQVPEVDIIAGGHEHDAQVARAGGALILKADADLRSVWVAEVETRPEGRAEVRARLIALGARIPPDPALRRLEDRWVEKLARRLGPDAPVAESEVVLEGRGAVVRSRESNLGNLIADALRAEGGCDLAVVNGGAIRIDENLPPGPLTRYRVAELFLFPNKAVRLRLPGRAVAAMMERSAARRGRGGFLQVSGLRVAFTLWEEEGARVRRIEALGAPLDEERAYTLCTLDYLARGGGGYAMLAEGGPAEVAGDPEEMFTRYVRARGRIAPRREGRIRFLVP